MRIYGYVKELVELWFKKDTYDVKVTPNSNTYTATTSFSLPPKTSGSDVLVGEATTQTLTNKALGSGTTITAGTITGATINADSNTITNIDNNEIKAAAAIDATKIAGGTVDNTEFSYLNGVTSSIQTQLDAKAPIASPTFTGTVTIPSGAALGTPASATLTNATGLPISTGVSGLGAGIATFLATPSSANLVSAVTDETGSGSLVFASIPTIVSPIIDNGLTMNHESTPATPSAGTVKVYPKSDNSLYVLDPNGVETQVGSGSGQGEKNYITNPSMKSATTGWSNVGDLDVARTTTASELPREYSTATGIKITADANTQSTADYVYFDFTLDDVDLSKKLKIQWSQKTTGSYNAGDLAVVITTQADRTTALHTPVTTAIPASTGDFVTTFDSSTTATLSLVIRATTDMTTDAGIVISDVVVGPGEVVQGAAISEWQTSNFTIDVTTNATTTSYIQRVGSTMNARIRTTFSGASNAGTGCNITMPSGYTINTTVYPIGMQVGSARYYDDSAAQYITGNLFIVSTTAFRVRYFDDAAAGVNDVNTTAGAPFTIAANDEWTFEFSVPIAEWAGNGTVNLGAGAQVEYAYPTGTVDADSASDGSATAYGPVGAAWASMSDTRNKYIKWQYHPQNGDMIIPQVSQDSGVSWSDTTTPWAGNASSTATAGVKFLVTSAAGVTRFQVGRYAEVGPSVWSSSYRIRFVKISPSAPVGFGLAGTGGNAGLVNPYTEGSGVVYANSYTPTITAVTNASSATLQSARYMRVGKVVTVACEIAVDAIATGLVSIGISLPVASDFTAAHQCSGSGSRDESTSLSVIEVRADTTNDRASCTFYASYIAGASTMVVNFTYIIA